MLKLNGAVMADQSQWTRRLLSPSLLLSTLVQPSPSPSPSPSWRRYQSGQRLSSTLSRRDFFPFPCLDLNGTPIGSCEYEGDFLLEAATDALCGDELTPGGYFPPGQACKLPLAPGVYGGGDPIVVTLPDSIPDLIVGLLANGKYHVDITLKNADGSENTCVKVHLELGD